MSKRISILRLRMCLVALVLCRLTPNQSFAATISVDGSQTKQWIDGFGVNANYWSYTNSELNPALDALIDQAGMTTFRVVFNCGWETNNDNSDPNLLNETYYNSLYAGPECQKLWGLLHYLEQKGLSNSIVLNFQGAGPAWMGGSRLTSGMEAEWAEMVVSLLLYARTNQHLQFHLVAPDNEPNIASEGIYVATAAQYVTMLKLLAQKLDLYGLSDFQFVVPDRTDGSTNFFPEIMNDPAIMTKVAHFGMHSYTDGGADSGGICSLVNQSLFADRKVWVTEFNIWCQVCETGGHGTNGWTYFRETADYLLDHLIAGASSGVVWEGYDSYYPHHGAWSYWGLLAVDNINASPRTYSRRKNFYTLSQVSKFVPPGSRRIGLSGSTSAFKMVSFFHDDKGQFTLTGINKNTTSTALSGTLLSLPALDCLDLYYTSSTADLAKGATIQISSNTFATTIPADCLFTLTGVSPAKQPISIRLTSPADGARYSAGENVFLEAETSTATGSISKVEFFVNSNCVCGLTALPYSFTWSNAQAGTYLLSARASNTVGNVASSALVRVFVPGPPAKIGISPFTALVSPLGAVQFSASAMDSLGTLLQPQPLFGWCASGGTIDTSGLFIAGTNCGGPFAISASSGGITGTANAYVSTNLALNGTGYTWYGMTSATANSSKTAATSLNDGDFSTDVPLRPGGTVDSANAYEAAGIIWPKAQTIRQVIYRNGSWTIDENGTFAADLQLQFSADGTTWTAADPEWTIFPIYTYNSPLSANVDFTFQGGTNSARGVRCAGRVRTSEASDPPNSWFANAKEVQVFNAQMPLESPILSVALINDRLILSWPVSWQTWTLESSDDLSASDAWLSITNSPKQVGGENWLNLPVVEGHRFFRLRR